MTARVTIIILNWNNAPDTLNCLQSIARLDYPNCTSLVVDNGSTDNSIATICQKFPDVVVCETGQNLGYAGGNNFGIRYALERGYDYIGVLNNDVTVEPGFMIPLLRALEDPGVGVVTPLVAEMGYPERVWALGSQVDWATGNVRRLHDGDNVTDLRNHPSFEVDIASGAAMFARREVFERAGLLNEDFYLYYEESDWCLRVRRAGLRIIAVPDSVALHRVSATLGQTSPVIDYYMLRNHILFVSHHWSGAQRYALLIRVVLRNLLTIVAFTFKHRDGMRRPYRDARLLALRDAVLGRWGKMGQDVVAACRADR